MFCKTDWYIRDSLFIKKTDKKYKMVVYDRKYFYLVFLFDINYFRKLYTIL